MPEKYIMKSFINWTFHVNIVWGIIEDGIRWGMQHI
jgi:hypothetical protein